MFDSLNVDEKKDPHGVASRIVEIMSCEENICMLDITAKPSDAKVDGIPSELTKEILPQVLRYLKGEPPPRRKNTKNSPGPRAPMSRKRASI